MQPEELRSILRTNLKARRNELALTQADVAKKAGVTQEYWSQLESGKRVPRLDLLTKLADALRTSPETLLSREVFSPVGVDA